MVSCVTDATGTVLLGELLVSDEEESAGRREMPAPAEADLKCWAPGRGGQ